MKYSIDSSSLITANRHYPKDIFHSLWNRLSESIQKEGTVQITEAVYIELEKQRDELFDWVKAQKSDLVIPIDEAIQQRVIEIQTRYPSLVDIENERDFADPFVIALAQINTCTVVTEEKPKGPGSPVVKIPNVCRAESIQCTNFLGMLRNEGWTF